MVFHYPGVLAPAEREATPRLADLMPTVLDLLGLETPSDLDGRSLSSVLGGGSDEERIGYLETRYPFHTFGWAPLRGLRTAEWKYVDAPRRELYDLRADPEETENLAEERPDVVERLHATLEEYAADAAAASETVDDPEVMAKLEALGYLSGGGGGEAEPGADLPDPKDRRTERRMLLAAESMFLAGDYGSALRTFEEVLFTDPDNRFALLRSGLAHLRAGQPDRAVEWLERAVAVDPGQPEVHYGLADALTRTGRFDEAVPHWQETIRLQPRRVAAWSNMASALTWSGRAEDGLAAFREATALEPGRADLWINLAAAESAAGRTEEARAALDEALRIDPEQRDAVSASPTLGPLLR
jgi:tetratricopeptide (TPR) repeat protein